ncbi:hypothetical protein [Brachybacterium sp. FME24]|uniref:hypothetical protein n=1 Tax=Brachybacterium sp. FME24 TaxID=2742605 RepID=UPI001867EEBF|nr:hypothetical protein [Brachybacterium sp. FME24]
MTSRAPTVLVGPTADPSAPQASAAPDRLSRAQRGIGRRDPLDARGLVRFLTKPAAFLAVNWAAMLGILTVIGIVPSLAAATRTTADLEQYQDAAFTSTLRHLRRTLVRDAPASALLLMVLGGIGANALALPRMDSSVRVFAVGLMLPLVWVMIALLSAYVVTAARDQHAERTTITVRALAMVMHRPLAALVAPALIAALSPLWLLAPLTIACGFSVPPWVVARAWGGGPADASS